MKNNYRFLLATLSIFFLTSCSGTSSYKGGVMPGPSATPSGEGADSGYDEGGEGDDSEVKIPAGQLTCSALDDNNYYEFWKSLTTSTQEGEGIFQKYKENFAFNTFNRLELNVLNGNDIKVKIKDSKFEVPVDNLNKAYLFPDELKEEYEVEITYIDSNNNPQVLEQSVKDGDTIDLLGTSTKSDYLQLMFVIDATGSMTDEIKYLQAEIDDVIAQIKEDNSEAKIELAIMMYRDKGDEYVTKYSDFTIDIAKQRDFLAKQKADGGGDFEEAVDVALKEAIVDKQWSNKATKLLFHVADAPSHDKDVQSWNDSVNKAASKGIKIITVASSGIDKKTEYFFRSQSLLTAGQYVYLTNDSGIGNDHLEATIQEPLVVEYLNSCLVRLINGYFTGEMAEPVSYQQEQ